MSWRRADIADDLDRSFNDRKVSSLHRGAYLNVPRVKPKRILALDGGGVRGIATIAFLERMEIELRGATGTETLGQQFDLIGGTSVGSIIACMLALDWPMQKVSETFRAMCPRNICQTRTFGVAEAEV